MRRRFLIAGALALAAISMLSAAGSVSATPVFSLRVEAPGNTLDPGSFYAPRTPIAAQRGKTVSAGNCVREAGDISMGGRTALGLVASAANANAALRPLLIVEDSFGKKICRIGGINETDTPFTGWLYRVNHAAPPKSGELVGISKTDEVLWYFANFGTGANTGDELVLTAPFRATPGAVQVSVAAVTFDGVSAPAPDGTVVSGGTTPVTTVGGVATVPVTASTVLRATGPGAAPPQIPSNQVPLCIAAQIEGCPPVPGRHIYGTDVRDVFKGTAGPDVIRTRGGKDKIRARGGGADVIDCGKGKDKAIVDKSDRTRRCEKVVRP
jgi:Ca2+-binding RTX toxin-like protein